MKNHIRNVGEVQIIHLDELAKAYEEMRTVLVDGPLSSDDKWKAQERLQRAIDKLWELKVFVSRMDDFGFFY